MLVPIIIDTQSLVDQFNIDSEDINIMMDNVAKQLAAAFANDLQIAAEAVLHQTRDRYISNILLIDSGRLESQVVLDYSKDKIVKMIEEGASAFDMKEGFSKSSKVKFNKSGGWYLTIPFRWSTPGAIGESGVFNGQMPSDIYKIIKSKQTTIPVAGGGTRSSGLPLSEIPSQFAIPKTRAATTAISDGAAKVFDEYTHKNSLFEGMVKQNDGVTRQNTYHSFRRVSENSEEGAWIHPGITKHDLFNKTIHSFQPENYLGELIDNNLRTLGFEP